MLTISRLYMRKRLYFTILILTVLFITDKYIIYSNIEEIREDLRIVNIAGSQRMLSQRIVKYVLYYKINNSLDFTNIVLLENNLNAFKRSHDLLTTKKIKKYNTEDLNDLFDKLNPHFEKIYDAGKKLTLEKLSIEEKNELIKIIEMNDADYLNIMDKIVKEYEIIGIERLNGIKSRENILNTMVILIFVNILFVSGIDLFKNKST